MHRYPERPRASNAPDGLFDRGHLWLFEAIDGAPLRFQLTDTGAIRFGDATTTFDPEAVPIPYRYAVQEIRGQIDRDALFEAVPALDAVTFFGVAPQRRSIPYEFDRIPGFFGSDIRVTDRGLLPPDITTKIYHELGLTTLEPIEKEVRAVDFDPDRHSVPPSTWYDGPAYGTIARNKTGESAFIPADDAPVSEAEVAPDDATATAEAFVSSIAVETRCERATTDLNRAGTAVSVDSLFDRVIAAIGREYPAQFDDGAIDQRAFSSALRSEIHRWHTSQ